MTKKPIKFNPDGGVYSPKEIDRVLEMSCNDHNLKGKNNGERFYNIPVAFDIEVSSFYRDLDGVCYSYDDYDLLKDENGNPPKLEKCAIMYVWQFGINGNIIIGRTWEEFIKMCDIISDRLNLSEKRRIIVYVHNLSYEFQFIRNIFTWNKVFSIDLRKPIYAITAGGIEFRCSYLLSGYSLGKLSEQLTTYKCAKKSGDLDYRLIRHSKTPLTEKEKGYCINDVKVVMSYIQERIEEYNGITNLPITKTGFVRKHCRKNCLRKKSDGKTVANWRYIDLMRELTITGIEEFNMLQRAFAGGFTHANANYTGETVTDVYSYDFTSSYPYVMVSEKFPMSAGVAINCKSMKQFYFLISKFACVFDVEFINIFASQTHENYISVSKCFIKEKYAENNGRIVSAKRIVTTITDIDFNIIRNFYTWQDVRIGKMYCYRKEYLPTEFIRSILELYEKKTQLKGVAGKEIEYLNSKEMLNSCYGMSVTNPLRDEFTYNGVWDTKHLTVEMQKELLEKYNTSENRFLFYPWGVFVTAYARRNLFTAIHTIGEDYVYSDTDSVKIRNAKKYKAYFDTYNNTVYNKLKSACQHHRLSIDMTNPKTIKGINKPLGVWDYEGFYTRFKTLGAKRYMVETENALIVGGKSYPVSLTVSGVNKKSAVPYLLGKYGIDGIFESFTNYLNIPPDATGKNLHTYLDYEISGEIKDYMGNVSDFREFSGVHLEATGYTLSLSVMYINYLRGIKFVEK